MQIYNVDVSFPATISKFVIIFCTELRLEFAIFAEQHNRYCFQHEDNIVFTVVALLFGLKAPPCR